MKQGVKCERVGLSGVETLFGLCGGGGGSGCCSVGSFKQKKWQRGGHRC